MEKSLEQTDFELAKALQDEEDREYRKIENEKRIREFEKQEEYRLKNQNSSVTVDYTRGQLGAYQEILKRNQQNSGEYFDDMDDYYDDYYDESDFSVNQQPLKKKHPNIDLTPVDEPDSFGNEFSGEIFSGGRGGDVEDEEFDFDTEINVKSKVSHSVTGKLSRDHSKIRQRNVKKKDVSDRATVENVMDQRTRLILFKMVNRQIIGSINGCVSTGKEANVYYARSVSGKEHYAVKVYKTSILQFKDRERYVEGEFRFQRYSNNPRKMVRMWAEKEMRNLKRLADVGIVVPKVHNLQHHVLVMEFIGRKGWPAKLLKDTKFTPKKYRRIYKNVVIIMRNMFQKAHLIHADFSEFNILFYKGKVIVIDVSQSVEFDHPNAMVFLKSDCSNIREYFRKRGVDDVLNLRQMFEFITADGYEKGQLNDILEGMMKEKKNTFSDGTADNVFKATVTPQKIEDIAEENFDYFKDRFVKKKNDEDLLENESNSDEEEEEEGEIDEEMEEMKRKKDLGKYLKNMDKKERKKLVKQMKAEKRKKKVPKKVKKRRKKVAQRGNKRI